MKIRMQFFRSVRFRGDWEWNLSGGWADDPIQSLDGMTQPSAGRFNWWSLRIGRSQFALWHNHEAIFNFIAMSRRHDEVQA